MSVEIHPQTIRGKWADGYALDLHTTSSTFLGYDGYGHPQFDTVRSDLGELLYKLKYGAGASAVEAIAETGAEFLKQKWRIDADLIVPVLPSNTGRKRQPVLEVARAIADRTGIELCLYWSIGRDLSQRFADEDWGDKIIDRLARDLQAEFPGVEGFSPRSLRYMRAFAEAWPDEPILQQVAAKLPWGHHMVLLDRLKGGEIREWYLRAALENGWSRNVLVHMISGQLHEREGKALTNFERALPPLESDLAEQILKDPYNFDFLTVTAAAREREVENGLRQSQFNPHTSTALAAQRKSPYPHRSDSAPRQTRMRARGALSIRH